MHDFKRVGSGKQGRHLQDPYSYTTWKDLTFQQVTRVFSPLYCTCAYDPSIQSPLLG